eukprot:scaffold75279_cov63-Phaeocystis_antarctica.AAC.1
MCAYRPQLVQRDGWRRLAIVVTRVIVGPLALLLPSLAPAVVRALLHRRRRLADEGQQHVADVVVGDLRRLLAPLLGRSAVGLIRRGARLVVQVDRLGLHAVADHSVLDDGTLPGWPKAVGSMDHSWAGARAPPPVSPPASQDGGASPTPLLHR